MFIPIWACVVAAIIFILIVRESMGYSKKIERQRQELVDLRVKARDFEAWYGQEYKRHRNAAEGLAHISAMLRDEYPHEIWEPGTAPARLYNDVEKIRDFLYEDESGKTIRSKEEYKR